MLWEIGDFPVVKKPTYEELKKLPIEIDKEIENQYRTMYYSNPLTFQDFLELEEKKKKIE